MRKQWSIEEILASLEAEAAVHRERAAHHAEQEALHREKRTHHEAEFEAVNRRLEDFRAVSTAALEVVARLAPRPGPVNEGLEIGPASRPRLTRILDSIVAELGPDQNFGPAWLAAEANRRFGDRLRRPVTARQMSDVLRRLTRTGRVRQVRKGKGRYEARFVRVG